MINRLTLLITLSAFMLSMFSVMPVYSSTKTMPHSLSSSSTENATYANQNMASSHNCPDHLVVNNVSQGECCDDNGIIHTCCGTACSGLYSTTTNHIAHSNSVSRSPRIHYIPQNAPPSWFQAPFRPPIS